VAVALLPRPPRRVVIRDAAALVLAQLRLIIAVLDIRDGPGPSLVEVGRHVGMEQLARSADIVAVLHEVLGQRDVVLHAMAAIHTRRKTQHVSFHVPHE
jgi:hypothetical protein